MPARDANLASEVARHKCLDCGINVIRCAFCRLPDRRIRGKGFELLAGPSMLHDETMDRLELYYRLSIIWLALLILMAGFTLVLLSKARG